MLRRIISLVLAVVFSTTFCLPICQADSLPDTVTENGKCDALMEDEFEDDSVIVVLNEQSSSINQVLSVDYFDNNLFVWLKI